MGTASSPGTDMAMDLGDNQATLLIQLLISFSFHKWLCPHPTLVHHNSTRLSSTARCLASPYFQQSALVIHVIFLIPLSLQYKFLMNLFYSKDILFFQSFDIGSCSFLPRLEFIFLPRLAQIFLIPLTDAKVIDTCHHYYH